MLVKITMKNGTTEWKTLEVRDADNANSEYTQDLLSYDDCVTIQMDDERGTIALMDEESFEWWDRVLERQEKVEALIEALKEAFGDL